MMCDICNEGGQVLGPFLKPMTPPHPHRVPPRRPHRPRLREVLRDTMYAATVTGSPVENACRLIKQYETEGRGYYGAALALLGRDADGGPGRRQPDRDPHRRRRPRRAAHASPPARPWCATPTRRTRSPRRTPRPAASSAPSGWCRRRRPRPATSPSWSATRTCCSPSTARNQRLCRVLAHRPGRRRARPAAAPASTSVVLDGEDDFVNMLRHVLGVLGMTSSVVRHDDYAAGRVRRLRPGDRRARARATRATTTTQDRSLSGRPSTTCSAAGKPFLAVCLGHQVLCGALGIPLAYKDIVFQGTQSPVGSTGGRSGSASTTPSSAGSATGRGAARRRRASRPTPRPATSTCSAGRTTAASSSTPSRSSPSTATT